MDEMEQVQMIAGSIAGLIFAAASWNMLLKAWRTKDLRSYSLGQLVLNNVGNLFYWFYVVSLPFGPIYFMHAFFTLASLLMLVWYFIYVRASQTRKSATRNNQARLSDLQTGVR
jgi:predicted permease